MFKNITVSDPYNLANTATTGMDVSSIFPSSDYIPALGQFNYCDFKCDDILIEHIIADIPTIFTIVSAEIYKPKLVRINYTMVNLQLSSLFESGSIYIRSGIFDIFN